MKRILLYFTVLLLLFATTQAVCAKFYYEIGEQRELLTVQQDGTIILDKEFTFHVLPNSTDDGTEIWVGLPTDGTKVTNAEYLIAGKATPVRFQHEDDNDEQQVTFKKFPPIEPGETLRFHFVARITDLVYWRAKSELEKSPADQRVAISFIPAWWDNAEVKSLVLMMDFPGQIAPSQMAVSGDPEITYELGGITRLTWKYSNLPPGDKVRNAVHLPRQYFAASFKPKKDWLPLWAILLIALITVGSLGLALWGVIYAQKYRRYQTPALYMKGQKAYVDFDPVEAGIFFNISTDLLAKLIVMGLIKKGAIEVQGDSMPRANTLEKLTWYEELFLNSVDENISVNEERWKVNYEEMLKHFYKLVEGYCGTQTKNYYTKWLRNTTFTENDDPRWLILQQQLASGIFDKPEKHDYHTTMPGYMQPYIPLMYLTIINPALRKHNTASYSHYFPGATGGGSSSGNGCACACACACASSGGCT